MSSQHDRAIERVARRQHGVFSNAQATSVGFTQRMIHGRLARGSWLRIISGVYALPSHEGSFLRQCWAAVLAERSAAVGGLTAAAILGFPDVRPGRIELVVPPGANSTNPLATLHRYLEPELTTLAGLPLTSMAQTVVDIAGRRTYESMERIVDTLILERRMTLDDLAGRVRRYEGTRRPGLPLVRALLADRTEQGWAPLESELERMMRKVLRPLGLDLQWQVVLPWRESLPGRRDAVDATHRLIIEGDSRRWHARFHDFDRDRWRDNQVVARGYHPIRLTWAHLVERPDEVRELVRETVRSRPVR